MIRHLTILLLLLVSSEKIEYKLLTDGFTKVPADENYFTTKYRNNKKLQVGPPKGVEFNVLYVPLHVPEPNTIYLGRQSEWPEFGTHAKMFYPNGCVNTFIAAKKYTGMTLDPSYQGYRGIAYIKKGKSYISTISEADDGTSDVDESSVQLVKVNGDTLMIKGRHYESYYIKDKSGTKTTYTANW